MDFPTILLASFSLAIVLMIVAFICNIVKMRLARTALGMIHKSDLALYNKILNGKNQSWIERGADSISDFRIWLNVSKELAKNERITEVVGNEIPRKFKSCKRIMTLTYILSMVIGSFIVAIIFLALPLIAV